MPDTLLKFRTGALSNVNSTAKVAGQVLFAVDEDNKGYIYYDKSNSVRILMSTDALYAETAQKDTMANIISSYYIHDILSEVSTTQYKFKWENGTGVNTNYLTATINAASATAAGLVTADTANLQTFAGNKKFNNAVEIAGTTTISGSSSLQYTGM